MSEQLEVSDAVLGKWQECAIHARERSLADGRAAGIAWAKRLDDPDPLWRLHRAFKAAEDRDRWLDCEDCAAGETFCDIAFDENDLCRDADDFWREYVGCVTQFDTDFVYGFADGALDVWLANESRL